MNNANEIRFRASSVGHLMTEPRSKSQLLSDGTITHLVDVFVSEKYGRKEDSFGKFIDKGNDREEDSITLLSRFSKRFYSKNSERLFNSFIQGEPDLFIGKSIKEATETIDTKTSWSAHTFFRAKNNPLEKLYYWQGQSYMDLTGAEKHTVAYCLVNGTEKAINDEKRRLAYSMGIIDTSSKDNELYVSKCKQIEINHIFDIKEFHKECPWFEFDNDIENWKWDIPMEERIHLIPVERNQSDIDRMHNRIKDCVDWMNDNLFWNKKGKELINRIDQLKKDVSI